MYTEEDLRATFGALEDEAPDAVRVLAGVDRARRHRTTRRRAVGMLAAAAFVAVAAVGSIVVATPEAPPTAAANRGGLSFPFAVDDVPGFVVAYRFVDFSGRSTAWVAPPGEIANTDLNTYNVEVFRKGRYDPTADRAGEPVRVNGNPGFYRTDMRCMCSSDTGIPGVVWEYAPNSWAMVQYQRPAATPGATPPADVREVALRIAGAVRFDRTTPMLVPFQVGYLPAGLRPAPAPGDMNTVVPGSLGTVVNLVGDSRALFLISSELLGSSGAVMHLGPGTTTVTADLGSFGVQVSGTGFSKAELNKILHSITPATDLYDPATWFEADKVIPLH
jgi:hypothetical protein